jgi:hypothetical protein
MKGKKSKIKEHFGGCSYAYTAPKRSTLSPQKKFLNIYIPFEEALKLNIAIDECIRVLNKYKRNKPEGKRAAMNLALHLNDNDRRITIHEKKLRK